MRIPGLRVSPPVVVGATLVVVLVVATLVAVALHASAPTTPGRTTPAAPAVSVAPAARSVPVARAVGSLAVLRDWDRARAAAWAAGDSGALRRLYVRGSPAGARDAAMLQTWRGRGLRVVDLDVQVLAVELRLRTARRIVLVVTDRLASATAVRQGRRRDLPRDAATTRRLELRRVGRRWLMASVQEVPGRAPPSPAASTARASGSAKS